MIRFASAMVGAGMAQQAEARYKPDAERLRWLAEHWNDNVSSGPRGVRAHEWIVANMLRKGGLAACIDCLRGVA